jgi:hypothetical protein
MDVWVVRKGCWDDRHVVGVYSSIEAVIAAHPVRPARPRTPLMAERPGGWQPVGASGDTWSNGLDWDDAMDADRYTVPGRA